MAKIKRNMKNRCLHIKRMKKAVRNIKIGNLRDLAYFIKVSTIKDIQICNITIKKSI